MKIKKYQSPAEPLPTYLFDPAMYIVKQKPPKKSFIEKLAESIQSARDAKIGAVGAQQIRDLYDKGENELASELSKEYLTKGAEGVLGTLMIPEFVTYGALGGLARLGAGTAGSAAGSWLLGKAGEAGDRQFGTTWMKPTGQTVGGFATFPIGMNVGYKGLVSAAAKHPFKTTNFLVGNTNRFAGDVAAKVLGTNIRNANFMQSSQIVNSTIKQLFKEYPELRQIGNEELYKQYYDTIFPASKVKVPYAHGTKSDLSKGLSQSVKRTATGAPETIGRDDIYFNLQPETSLQYTEGTNIKTGTWNKNRYWPLKEILGKPYTDDSWMTVPIELRKNIPNRAGKFSRVKLSDGTFKGSGKLLEEYKSELGMSELSDSEFLRELGVKKGETFKNWVERNRKFFKDIYDSGNYKGLYHAKIDAVNPLTINGGDTYYGERGIWDLMKRNGNDVLLHNNAANEFGSDVLVVKDINSDPNKVRILGSEPDKQSFSEFIGGKYKIYTPKQPQPSATTYDVRSLRVPKDRPITEAERLGIPKHERKAFDWNQIQDLIPRFNKWAEYYGYKPIPESTKITDAVDIMKQTFNRHNTFFRGLQEPYNPEDIASLKKIFGENYNIEEVYPYMATHGRPGDNVVFVSPVANAAIYGSNGRTAILKRKFKLGKDPKNWLKESDFDIEYGGTPEDIERAKQKITLSFPWSERGNGSIENELLLPNGNASFIGYVPKNEPLSYIESNGSLNKYLGRKFEMIGGRPYYFEELISKPEFKQGGTLK